MDVVCDASSFADPYFPWKLAENKIRASIRGLEMFVYFAEIIYFVRCAQSRIDHRQFFTYRCIVPMPVVFGQVSETLVRIEKDVFVPVIADAIDLDRSPFESNDLIIGA